MCLIEKHRETYFLNAMGKLSELKWVVKMALIASLQRNLSHGL
jgi:hypothetical protein